MGLVALVAVAITLSSCSFGSATPRVALFGDSLATEAQPYYSDLLAHAEGETGLIFDSYGGTAVCDWLTRMQEVEAQYHPKLVELVFSGNDLTPCMHGYELYTPAYYQKYRSDTLAAIDIFVPGGAHVFLVGAPITREQQATVPGWQVLNAQYAEIAADDRGRVTYVDAGAAAEGPDHTYAKTLPCLVEEPCVGPSVRGIPSNVVRSPDGTHFCPSQVADAEGVMGACDVYSSGAYRYAKAMVDALPVLTR